MYVTRSIAPIKTEQWKIIESSFFHFRLEKIQNGASAEFSQFDED